MSSALDQNLELLTQGIDLLDRIDEELYSGDETPYKTSYSVGPHLRHCIDAYGCLISGLEEGRVDYDARRRRGEIETERAAGARALVEVRSALEEMRQEDPHRQLEVKVDTPSDTPGAWSRSTLRRELQFLVGHTVHHFALIALILRGSGFEPGEGFGVASSTLRHWATREAGTGGETGTTGETGIVG